MPYSIGPGDPTWTADFTIEIERQVATFAKANGLAGQAAWTAFIGNINTLAQAIAVVKGVLTAVKCSAP